VHNIQQKVKRVRFSVERLRRQAEGYNFTQNTMQSNKCLLLCVNNGQVPCRRTAIFEVLWY